MIFITQDEKPAFFGGSGCPNGTVGIQRQGKEFPAATSVIFTLAMSSSAYLSASQTAAMTMKKERRIKETVSRLTERTAARYFHHDLQKKKFC
jgi:hypothetical protein